MIRGRSENVSMKHVHGAVSVSWPDTNEKGRMESQRLCAYNETKRSLLGLDVVAGDFSNGSLADWMARLAPQTRAGLWLVPFRGIAAERGSAPLDLVYLDADCGVIDLVEFFPNFSASASTAPAASLLVLPSHTIHTSRTAVGDRLILSSLEEMRGRQGHASNQIELAFGAPAAGRGPVLVREDISSVPNTGCPQLTNTLEVAKSTKSVRKQDTSLTMCGVQEHVSRSTRLVRWLFSGVQDRAKQRQPATGLFAFFWTGGAPQAHVIRDINSSGLYVRTSERWYIGTVVRMILSLANGMDSSAGPSICVHAEAIQWGNDGVELRFVVPDHPRQVRGLPPAIDGADREQLAQFLEMWRDLRSDQSMTKAEAGPDPYAENEPILRDKTARSGFLI